MRKMITATILACLSCNLNLGGVALPVETEFSLVNLSRRWYATIALRPAATNGQTPGQFVQSKLIAPGAVFRERFFELFPETGGCPDRLDIRVHLYKRANEDVPIGMDPGEAVLTDPVASAEISDIVACEQVVASTFTIVLLDTDEGEGAVRFAQETGAEATVRFNGNNLANLDPVPDLLDNATFTGEVLLDDGTPVENIGVLVRTRFRITDNDPELFFSDPIAITITDMQGSFSFDRPPGAYLVEVFADDFEFRPVSVMVESPLDNITFFAEPLP